MLNKAMRTLCMFSLTLFGSKRFAKDFQFSNTGLVRALRIVVGHSLGDQIGRLRTNDSIVVCTELAGIIV